MAQALVPEREVLRGVLGTAAVIRVDATAMTAAVDDLGQQVAEDMARLNRRADTIWMRDNPDSSLRFTWADDYPQAKAPETVVEDLIERGGLIEVFGESNSGKSTFVLDMALAVARPDGTWRERSTTHGAVLWIALESAAGLRRRVQAHRTAHDTDQRLLFADVTVPVRLLDVKDVDSIITTAQVIEYLSGQPCQLVVVDTVARALGGGDENDGRDMGTLVRGCDMIRAKTGAAVLLIHHSGKDTSRGARGHSSLRAAVDTEIEISGQENPRQAKVTKQRDLPSGDVFAFDLDPVEIGRDGAKPITACIVRHRNDVAPRRKAPSGRNQQLMLGAVRQWVAEHGDIIATPHWHQLCKAQGLAKPRWSEVRDTLVRDGWLVETIGGIRYVP
jgi:RecA/RadA recombinase